MREFKAYHKNSDVVKYKRYEGSSVYSYEYTYNEQGKALTYKNSSGYSHEYTYNEQGKALTYKNSSGEYKIKGEFVTKQEFDAFVNDEIITVNGVKYKKI
jgi:YD repeat-containing protein